MLRNGEECLVQRTATIELYEEALEIHSVPERAAVSASAIIPFIPSKEPKFFKKKSRKVSSRRRCRKRGTQIPIKKKPALENTVALPVHKLSK